jgi:hypothetical protein
MNNVHVMKEYLYKVTIINIIDEALGLFWLKGLKLFLPYFYQRSLVLSDIDRTVLVFGFQALMNFKVF